VEVVLISLDVGLDCGHFHISSVNIFLLILCNIFITTKKCISLLFELIIYNAGAILLLSRPHNNN